MARFRDLAPGDPAPFATQKTTTSGRFVLDTVAGRYLVFCFYDRADSSEAIEALKVLEERRSLFNDEKVAFFGISTDPATVERGQIEESVPGIRHFLDYDLTISKLYGAASVDGPGQYVKKWMVIDPNMRVRAVVPMAGPDGGRGEVVRVLQALPAVDCAPGVRVAPPVLVIANVFEPDFCKHLISLYEQDGGTESGIMKQINGMTVGVMDHSHKRRADYMIEDEKLQQVLQAKIRRRVLPEIMKVHQFNVTRMERYLVGCYDSETGGHFRPHRDNTTSGTAHRRFAVSINLNNEFEGGEVSFPEYGQQGFKMPAGTAVVFSCSLLHAVSRVTSGRRFAFLPFLYDDAAAELRQRNLHLLQTPEDAQGKPAESKSAMEATA